MSLKLGLSLAFYIVLIPLMLLIVPTIIYFGWNYLAKYFGFKTITFVVAIIISVLLSIVGGFFRRR